MDKIQTAEPTTSPTLYSGDCPVCEHDDLGERRGWVSRLFNLKPSCPRWQDSTESDAGMSGECGCTHPFHR